MTAERWQRLKGVLGAAFEKNAPSERVEVIESMCAPDPDLLSEARSLLQEAELLGEKDELEDCAETAANALDRDKVLHAGDRLGAYVIVRELGWGGMGSVYLGTRADGHFEKQVAIKVLGLGERSAEILQRFEAERHILAGLDHPNIARLLDAGTTAEGAPYFIMDYVSGIRVTDYVKNNRLLIPKRLELFLKICAAVETAHRESIVHCDLKPSNILVNEQGEPKLLDFGIAKIVTQEKNGAEITATGRRRLSPVCASPEQATGAPVTPASDVYSLGALLYEILTGCSPRKFSSRDPSLEELEHVAREQTPLLPSAATSEIADRRELKGDLDAIILCALRKEPEGRYASVRDFSEDIQRYLTARPIRARPNTSIHRLRLSLARNRERNLRFAVGLIGAASLFGILFLVSPRFRQFFNANSPRSAYETSRPINAKGIAVLPFTSFDKEIQDSYFVDGVQDDILTDLAKVSDLKVISRSGVERYRNVTKDAREIGRDLGVASVLEGTVQRSTGRVRVNVRLVDTRTDAQIWSEHYERAVDDLFALQSELAQSIVVQLQATLSSVEKAAIERQPTQDMQAYDLYLQARALMDKPEKGLASKQKALELTEEAIARDPKFTLAYCLAAKGHVIFYRWGEGGAARLARAKEAADAAVRLAPGLAEAHLAQALYYLHGLHDYLRTQDELTLAAPTLNGQAEFLLLKAVNERRLGHWKDALQDGEKSLALNPHDYVTINALVDTYRCLHMYSQIERLTNETIAQTPVEDTGYLWLHKCDVALDSGALDEARKAVMNAPQKVDWKTGMLALISYYERNYTEAIRLVGNSPYKAKDPTTALFAAHYQRLSDSEKSRSEFLQAKKMIEDVISRRPDDPNMLGNLAVAYAGLGEKENALATINRAAALAAISRDAIDGAICINNLAEVYALLGQPNEGLEQLAKVASLPNGPSYGDLRFNPVWDGIRDNPRFQEILTRSLQPPVYN